MSKNSNHRQQMKRYSRHIAIFVSLMLGFLVGAAQKKKSLPQEQMHYNTHIQINSDLADWGDSLRYFYDKQDLQYEIGQDDTHIYVAMRVKDNSWQMQALHQGFSFVINPNGKKKEGVTLVFPVPDSESLRALAAKDKEEQALDVRVGILSTVRGIYVKGMTDVVDGLISLENNYGVKTAVFIDSADALCYEAAIPFERINSSLSKKKALAFNVKINGMVMRAVGGGRPMNRYGYGGRGYPYGAYGMQQPTRKEAHQEPGLWLVLPLVDK